MIGQTISHYKILAKLGGGGMGIVYKAEDTKLKRTVALKFLPPELTRDEEAKERFVQEAQTASALDHPNICTIYEIDEIPITLSFPSVEETGQLFIAMAYYDGETLKKKVSSNQLSVSSVIDFAMQIARGLAKAHQHGIVHRDIKPANVMVTGEGVVKIIDFGLSKLAGTKSLTKSGTTLGTPAYMSPEQMSQVEADHRTDIWSLGVVMYEMATRQLPFREENELALVYSIVNEKPAPMTTLRSDLPIELERIVDKAMQKDRRKRYQRMEELLVDLRQLKGKSPVPEILLPLHEPEAKKKKVSQRIDEPNRKALSVGFIYPLGKLKKKRRALILSSLVLFTAVAVLLGYLIWPQPPEETIERIPVAVADFVNETKEDELDGLSGMLITALEQSRRLSVLTRSRMFDVLKQMGKRDVDRIDETLGKEICQRANVKTLVVASIRKFGKLYTIDLKIIDLEKNEHLFVTNETGEGQESIPELIDNLSAKTRAGLKERDGEIHAASQNVADITTINLEAYQHYFLSEQLIHELNFKAAEAELKKAVALDSTFGLAYYRLSYVNRWRYFTEPLDESESIYHACLQKAEKLLDRIPLKEKYLVRAQRALLNKGGAGALVVLKEMEKLYPDEKEMLYQIGDESFHGRKFDTAAIYLEKVLAMDPTFERALQHLVRAYADLGQYDKMLAAAQKFEALNEVEGNYYIGEAYCRVGDYQAAQKYLNKFLHAASNDWLYRRAMPYIAATYVNLGQYQKISDYIKRHAGKNPQFVHIAFQAFMREKKYQSAEKFLLEAREYLPNPITTYWPLVRLYPYLGKYRQTLTVFEEFMARCRQASDSAYVPNLQIFKAFYYVWGWNDFTGAWREAEKALQSEASIYDWENLAILYVCRGDYAVAESLAVQKEASEQMRQFIRLFVQCGGYQCVEAQALADSLVPSLPEHKRTWALYALAKCQFETGQNEAATAALRQIQKPSNNAEGFHAVFYPKSFYLMAKIYEKQGDVKLAIENYEKLLALWKEADADLPELIETKARLAALR
ncbi:protein kinase [candidate division KSB1 bacterium]|nr:protein kinase [candidate division KSB1 bacterium]